LRKKLLIFSLVLIAVIMTVFLINFNRIPIHKPISLEEVETIVFFGTYRGIKEPTQEEKVRFVEWFNSAYDIRLNKYFAGTTPESGISIVLKSGKNISVIKSGFNFDIRRNNVKNERISYWAKQKDIEKLLADLASEKRE